METRHQASQALEKHWGATQGCTLNELFITDPQRGSRLRIAWEGVVFDYAKHRVSERTLELLIRYADTCRVDEWIARMFAGEVINQSENQAVLHAHQRLPEDEQSPESAKVWERLTAWVDSIHCAKRTGITGKPFRHVVNIGIGGSSVGPEMVINALQVVSPLKLKTSFLTSLDVAARRHLFASLDPEETLFVVVSKSFNTQETLQNARFARQWLSSKLGDNAVKAHFAGVSANPDKMVEFGLAPDSSFSFPHEVGGRYSLWSPAGVSIALALSMAVFNELRAGAALADAHFSTAPIKENIPMLMGLIGYWYRSFGRYSAHAVISYSQALSGFVPWLQQLEMESNGKQVTRTGEWLSQPAVPVIFGGVGTDVQHTFFQMLHQGVEVIPVDFIVFARPPGFLSEQEAEVKDHQTLLANALAQSRALMCGSVIEDTAPERAKSFSGNRPSATFLLDTLTPGRLGQLMALYEHKVFVQGCLWNINSFDQWGVELGKKIAEQLADFLTTDTRNEDSLDSSTSALLEQCKRWIL